MKKLIALHTPATPATATVTTTPSHLQELIHDLAGPLTALTMTLPELTKALHQDPRISTQMYLELCNEATTELHKKLEALRSFASPDYQPSDRIQTL